MIIKPSISIGIPSTRDFSFISKIINQVDYKETNTNIVIARQPNFQFSNGEFSSFNTVNITQVISPKKQSTCMRNTIISNVNSDYVLFLDDDMLPSKNILQVCNDLILKNPNGIFQGTPYITLNTESWLARMEGRQYERIFKNKLISDSEVNHIDARILLAPVKLLKQIPFDEKLVNGRDGHDLAEKLLRGGNKIYYAASLTGKHFYRTNWSSVIKQKIRQGKGRGQILLSKSRSSLQWVKFFMNDFYGHFIQPIFNTISGRIKFSDLLYIHVTHFFYWGSTLKTVLFNQKL
jgi:hypothetical protein